MHHAGQLDIEGGIAILDYGSQYTLLIARKLRELGVYSEIFAGNVELDSADQGRFSGVVLSGGPESVGGDDAPAIPDWVIASGKPILGICYGMQLIAERFGGEVKSGGDREYGRAHLKLSGLKTAGPATILDGIPDDSMVWMSHGDDVSKIPDGFACLARSETGVPAVFAHQDKPIIGLQFHPEVKHTEFGQTLLKNFFHKICAGKPNWNPADQLVSTLAYIKDTVGDGKVLMAVSGGVDSTVAVALLAKALGSDKVTAVFVDNGLLRKNEVSWVEQNLKGLGVSHLEVLDRKDKFLSALKGVTDPEQKRKIIGNTFIEEFEDFATHHKGFTHLGQGTLYPDVIESAGHGHGSKVIKSHHNVGGLPETLKLELVEPFRFLFKDEVRSIGRQLGIASELVDRHPFPGPGLGVRILGEVSAEKVAILQQADDIFISMLRERGFYSQVWQAFVVLLPVKSVGVMGDFRTYQWTAVLRAVNATDGMTASVGDLPLEFLVAVADKIVRQVDGINRVAYDITSKPPGTIEWE